MLHSDAICRCYILTVCCNISMLHILMMCVAICQCYILMVCCNMPIVDVTFWWCVAGARNMQSHYWNSARIWGRSKPSCRPGKLYILHILWYIILNTSFIFVFVVMILYCCCCSMTYMYHLDHDYGKPMFCRNSGNKDTNYMLAILDSRMKIVAHERFQYVLLKKFGETKIVLIQTITPSIT